IMPLIKVEDRAHVRFEAPALAAMRAFLEGFGMTVFEEGGRLYGKGSDGRPFVHVTERGDARFLAIGLRAETIADLDRLGGAGGGAGEDPDAPRGGRTARGAGPPGVCGGN